MVTLIATLLAQGLSLAATNYGADVPMHAPDTPPAWADEFGGKIDQTRWRFDTGRNRQGWANHEKQYYAADRRENARIEHGALVIEARREALSGQADWGGQAYSSAKLVSREALGYGFYEIRAKLPCGRGTWPAIWLLPEAGNWPDMGEIDVMEMVGWQPLVVHATVHSGPSTTSRARSAVPKSALPVPAPLTTPISSTGSRMRSPSAWTVMAICVSPMISRGTCRLAIYRALSPDPQSGGRRRLGRGQGDR
jgi:hypothetical protein